MNLSAAAAQANADFCAVGIKEEADLADHCPNPRSRRRASASGTVMKAPVRHVEHRHVQVAEFRSSTRSLLSAGPPFPRPPA